MIICWTIACPLIFAGSAFAQSDPSDVVVVYDVTTGALDEVIVPDNQAEINKYLLPHATASFPNGRSILLPISQINAQGFTLTLAAVCILCVSPQQRANVAAAGKLVMAVLARNDIQTAISP